MRGITIITSTAPPKNDHAFADTFYFLALLNVRDEQHGAAEWYSHRHDVTLITSSWVIIEVADALSLPHRRMAFLKLFDILKSDPNVLIVEAHQHLLERGIEFFAQRPDKAWSLTDCISFVIMQERGLREALTGDHHFEQAGFVALLK